MTTLTKAVDKKIDTATKDLDVPMPVKDAAAVIVAANGKPMKANVITDVAIEKGLIKPKGKTPKATMQALLSVAAKEKDRFLRTAPGTYGLIGRDKKGQKAA